MAQPEPTDGDGGSPHHSYSNNSFESSLVRYPCRTVCNIFWGNRLATQPYYCDGDRPVAFSSLWPDVRTFVELYSEGEMTVALPDIIRLLLASRSYPQLEGLVERGHIGWDHRMEQDQCTLIHLLCALKCEPLVESALKQLPQNGLLGVKDKDGELHTRSWWGWGSGLQLVHHHCLILFQIALQSMSASLLVC